MVRTLLPLAALFSILVHAEGVPSAQYRERRAALRKALADGVVVLFGDAENPRAVSRTGFYQESNFYYLSGWPEPNAILLIDPDREILFLPKKNPAAEMWTGPKLSPESPGIAEKTGFASVMASEFLERELRKSLETHPRIYAFPDTPETSKLKQLAPLIDISSPRTAIARLRMKKSPEEIALIERATEVTIEGHRAAWKKAAPGLYEYQVAGVMTAVFADHGCARHAYSPIVGSGVNATVLHYSANSRRMDRGEALLMDVAAECNQYASDVTRTIPVGGKFSKRQREIYEIVLGAQKAAIAAIKPGVTIGNKTLPDSLGKIAFDYIDSHGKDKEGRTLGRYFTHGIGHHVGLDVHDASDPALPLEAGMVITIEPGIYIPDEGIGVRIEDTILVTDQGAKILSEALPREASEVEKALGR